MKRRRETGTVVPERRLSPLHAALRRLLLPLVRGATIANRGTLHGDVTVATVPKEPHRLVMLAGDKLPATEMRIIRVQRPDHDVTSGKTVGKVRQLSDELGCML